MSKGQLGINLAVVGLLACSILVEALQSLGLLFSIEFHRDLIAQGQWWRVISGHLDHLGWKHLLLNALFFVFLSYLFERVFSAFKLLALWLVVCLLISAALYFFSPNLTWYVGLSGSLYGILVIGLILDKCYPIVVRMAVLVMLFLKIGFEQLSVSVPAVSAFIEGPVAIDAHLYGVISGLLVAIVLKLMATCLKETIRKKEASD